MYLINNSKIPEQCNRIKKLFNQCESIPEKNSDEIIKLSESLISEINSSKFQYKVILLLFV